VRGVTNAEFLVRLDDVVVGTETEDKLRVGSAGLVAVGEEGVQGEKGRSVEVLGGQDLWGSDVWIH